MVAEAERLAPRRRSGSPAASGCAQLVDTWKGRRGSTASRTTSCGSGFSHARSAFSKRRKAHFAALDAQREEARRDQGEAGRRGRGAVRLHRLGADRGALPRADGGVEGRPGAPARATRTTCGTGSAARRTTSSRPARAVFAERDAEQRENLEAKEELLAEAEKLLPVTDLRAARAAFRSIKERWEAIGHGAPRRRATGSRAGCARWSEAIREAEEAEWRRTNPEARARAEATVGQLQRRRSTQLETAAGQGRRHAGDGDKDVKEAERGAADRRAGPGSRRPSARLAEARLEPELVPLRRGPGSRAGRVAACGEPGSWSRGRRRRRPRRRAPPSGRGRGAWVAHLEGEAAERRPGRGRS